jgi:hypothetical protein
MLLPLLAWWLDRRRHKRRSIAPERRMPRVAPMPKVGAGDTAFFSPIASSS